jgi:hypothetical protein
VAERGRGIGTLSIRNVQRFWSISARRRDGFVTHVVLERYSFPFLKTHSLHMRFKGSFCIHSICLRRSLLYFVIYHSPPLLHHSLQ